MAKLVVSILTSLDGYCAGPGGRLDQLPMGQAFDAHNLELLRKAGTMLFGAVTFPMFEAYWPDVDRSASGDLVQAEIAERVEAARKVVVSNTLVLGESSPWPSTEIISRERAIVRIAELKAEDSPDLVIFGSSVLFNALLSEGLVDELHLLVGNVALGEGVPVFDGRSSTSFGLLDQRRLAGSDIVALHFECRE